jgi:WD40 repeat protein
MIGPYRLLEKVGEGGMGEVWAAEQREPVRRRVALKIIKRGMDTKQVMARFEAERQALAMMNHPTVAKIFDAGETPRGRPYFVMEYVEGVPITEHCDRQRLTLKERLELFVQVCAGVQHAHQKAIIHRDLKPSNVLVTIQDGKPIPKIIDFGVAKATAQPLTERTIYTQLGVLIGTPEYMSPEQAEMTGQSVDTRTDVYSLGVIIYELLVGTLPFDPRELRLAGFDEIRRKIREEDPSRPSTKVTTLGDGLSASARNRRIEPGTLTRLLRGDLDWITMKALEKDRSRRYGSPSDLAGDIERYLNSQPVVARPPSAWYRARKFVSRHVVGVGLGTLLIALLLVGITATALFGMREARMRREALWQSYVANIAAANASFRLLDVEVARRHLSMCPQQLRGWEWFYLDSSIDTSVATLKGHTEYVRSVVYSPDGKRIVSASDDGTIRIWDAASFELVRTLEDSGSSVVDVAFSPNGKNLASAHSDGLARMWNPESGEVLTALVGHESSVTSVVFSPDGKRVASGSLDDTLRQWDAVSGVPLTPPIANDGMGILSSVAYSPDGNRIGSPSEENRFAYVWDAETGKLLHSLNHGGPTYDFSFSPDGKWIATCSADGSLRLWDALTGEQRMMLAGHEGVPMAAAFSPDSAKVVAGYDDNSVRLWDVTSGTLQNSFVGHGLWVGSVTFSPDGSRIASGSGDETVRLWDVDSAELPETLSGHESEVLAVAFSRDGTRIASGSGTGEVFLWDVVSGELLAKLAGHGGRVASIAFSTQGDRLASASYDGTIRVWDPISGELQATLTGHGHYVTSVSFSPDGAKLASGSVDKTVRLWDASSGEPLSMIDRLEHTAQSVAFSPDGKRIATCARDEKVSIWDAGSGELQAELTGHQGVVISVAFSPDGTRIASGGADKAVRLWDSRSGELLATLVGHGDWVDSVVFSPDGTRLVSGGDDNLVRVWDADSGDLLITLVENEDWVNCVAFSPDGTRIASGGVDETVRLWDSRPHPTRLSERQAGMVAWPAMEKLVGKLWKEHGDAAPVAAYLKKDASLSAQQRRVALDILLKRSSQFQAELMELLRPYFARLVTSEEVMAALEADDSLEADTRRKAVRMAKAIGDGALRLIEDSWRLLSSVGGDQAKCEIGLRGAEAAAAVQPTNARALAMLSIAQYRTGRFEHACTTADRSDELFRQEWTQGLPQAIAVKSMALLRLERTEEARAAYAELEESLKSKAKIRHVWSGQGEAVALSGEATRLFSGLDP